METLSLHIQQGGTQEEKIQSETSTSHLAASCSEAETNPCRDPGTGKLSPSPAVPEGSY